MKSRSDRDRAIGRMMRQERRFRGLSQYDLAAAAGVSQPCISRYESKGLPAAHIGRVTSWLDRAETLKTGVVQLRMFDQ